MIHGTNNPNSFGRNVSKGCIRMKDKDIEFIYDIIQKGDYVIIRKNEPPAAFSPKPQF